MQAWSAERLPHAIVLQGVRGLGKEHFAGALTEFVLCRASDPGGRPCGDCRACTLNHAGTHPDAIWVHPAEDKTTIGVDQIRVLGERLALASFLGGYKVAVLSPAERMTVNAANSLLKTLEEPPPSTLLILVHGGARRLPATVISRCQRLAFAVPSRHQAHRWLEDLSPGQDWEALLAFAGGAPLRAQELARQGFAGLDEELAGDLVAIASGGADAVQVAAAWANKKNDLELRLDWLEATCIALIRIKSAPGGMGAGEMRTMHLHGLAESLDLGALFLYLDRVGEARRFAEGGANRQLLLESLLLPWVEQLDSGANWVALSS